MELNRAALAGVVTDRLRVQIGEIADRVDPTGTDLLLVEASVGPRTTGTTGPGNTVPDIGVGTTGDANTRLPPGALGPQRALPAKALTGLIRSVLTSDSTRRTEIWVSNGNEALVRYDSVRVSLAEGVAVVGLTLETDQSGPQELTTVFALGTKDRPAGLLAVAEERPRGHGDLAATFAEAIIATCWGALLGVVSAVAASAGTDSRGDPLVPLGVVATAEHLVVLTQADQRLGQRLGQRRPG